MLEGGANEVAAIDGRTVSVEDAQIAGSLATSMDVKKMIGLIGAFYWLVMTIIVVPGAVIATFFTIMLPAMFIWIPLHNWIDHKMCRMVNDHWVSASQNVGLNVIEYGDDISEIADKRVLFLANHLGLLDHFVVMSAMYNKGTIAEKYLWVIFNLWKMTPLGAMWLIHGNYFINGGASQRERLLKQFAKHLLANYWKHDYGWVVMYPEGSRLFLIRESNARYAKKNGLKVFRNCALPRSGCAHVVLDIAGKTDDSESGSKMARCGLGGAVEYVVDCTLGYPKGDVPDLGKYMIGDFPHKYTPFGIHYKIYPTKAEWADEEKLKQWLYDRYEEKDHLLDYYYTKGTFPMDEQRIPPRTVQFPFSRCVTVETFWILLFYAHYYVWMKPFFIFLLQTFSSIFI